MREPLQSFEHGEVFVLNDGGEVDLDLETMNVFSTSIYKVKITSQPVKYMLRLSKPQAKR